MRYILFISLTLSALTFAACTYSTDFVVVNESGRPIEVRYKIKGAPAGSPTPLYDSWIAAASPLKTDASQIGSRVEGRWQQLSPDRYQFDRENRTVTVVLSPLEALRVTSLYNYAGHEDFADEASWPIEEISIAGEGGGMTFAGPAARKSFTYVSGNLFTLTYK
jgi:hypothetical protein